jgi:hypothetical protein
MSILKSEIYKLITENDGSCRDINFGGVEWTGVKSLIKKLYGSYSNLKFQLTRSGKESNEADFEDAISRIHDSKITTNIYAVDPNEIIQQLQIYIFTEENGQPFIEFTFFPQDLNLSPERIDEFINLVREWCDALQAELFFVRYENASWKFGDTSKYSGVIYSSNMEIA